MKSHLKLAAPTTKNQTVTPLPRKTSELRTRESGAEVERLGEAAKGNRYGHRHGLRASELVDLRWDQIDFDTAALTVRRVKKGTPVYPSDPNCRRCAV